MKDFSKRVSKVLRLLSNRQYRRGLFQGVAATIEHEAALRNLAPETVLDVGANKGQFSLLMRTLYPQVAIHAFEPLSGPAECFLALFKNDHRTTLHPVALGHINTEAEIHVSGREDSSSLLTILPRQEALYPGTREVGTRMISVRRGDDIFEGQDLRPPLLIKLDVQGFEKAVLEGMPRLLSRTDYVYTEIAFQELYANQALADDILAFMHQHDFVFRGIYNLSMDESGHPVYADAFFARRAGNSS